MSQNVQPKIAQTVDQLNVRVYEERKQMGQAAGNDVVSKMKELLADQEHVRMIFASAPSQNEIIDALADAEGIDWSRVTAFHMDEYIGLPKDHPQRFSQYLHDRLFDRVPVGNIQMIDSSRGTEEECERYAALLAEAPIDIVCLGIGENGHIAFNDPPVADFNDPVLVKPIELDAVSRQQQVNDGCFPNVDAVPTHALTLTIPALMSGKHLYCVVPGPTKQEAIQKTLNGPVTTDCPASILRQHADCTLYLDTDAYGGE